MDTTVIIEHAVAEHRKGNFQEAIRLYREVMSAMPELTEPAILAATALRQSGSFTDAVTVLQEYLNKHPDNGKLCFELALTMKMAGSDKKNIIDYLEMSVKNGYKNVNSCFLLGDMYRLTQQYESAICYYHETIVFQPDHFLANFSIGMIYKERGNFEKAREFLEKSLELQPHSAEVLNNLGLLHEQLGEMPVAESYFKLAINQKPDNLAICSNYVNLLTASAQYDRAIELLEKMLVLYPLNAELSNGIANILWKKGDSSKARDWYVKAIQIKNDYAEAHYNLGLIMREWNQLDEAVVCFNNAVMFDKKMYGAYLNLGETLQVLGDIEHAELALDMLLKLDSENENAYHNLLLTSNYNEKYSPEQVYLLHKKWGDRKSIVHRQFENSNVQERPLRIGYVSPDFCRHPVAQFLEPVFANQSRNVENYCYAHCIHHDSMTDYFKAMSAKWTETQNLSDEECAQRILGDHIDILVDCAGHMGGNRLGIFSMKPAPVQVSAFGYPCTTGLSSIDYCISDSVTETNNSQQLYCESLMRIDTCFCAFSPPEGAPEITLLPAMKNGFITFGSLHTTSRLNFQVISLWAEILRQIPLSRLLIFRTTLCKSVVDRLQKWFTDCNVDISRIDFVHKVPEKGYLSVYEHIDCQLDTFPWSGHTTACESLWMGVPVITLMGDRHAGRMVSSVLSHCDMKEWCTVSKEEYVKKAVRVSENSDELSTLRMNLRQKMQNSPLMDGKQYTQKLENCYRTMWKKYCLSNK